LASLGSARIPTWTTPLFLAVVVSALLSGTSFVGHVCAVLIGYLRKIIIPPSLWLGFTNDESQLLVGLGYLKVFVPPEKIIRWIEGKLNLLGRLPHYVSVDQKTHGRYGVLPTTSVAERGEAMTYVGTSQRLGQ